MGPTKARNSWWTKPVSWDEVCRRARGRANHNSRRRLQARLRQREVLRLVARFGWKYGVQSLIAAHLGVHKSTISWDFRVVFPLTNTCPTCGQLKPRAWWRDDAADEGG
jgi:butyrate kinase